MFTTPKVPVFMQKASVEGRKENKMVRYVFYITPIKHALATELSPVIAKSLFTFDAAGEPHPILEMDLPHFNIGKIPLQLMALHPSDDPAMDKYGTMLQRVKISHICARKIFPDDPNFTLEFRAEVPMDNLAIQLLEKYYDQKLFLTFEDMQLSLPNGDAATCSECGDPAICVDQEEEYFCDKHRNQATGEVNYITKMETPAEAAAAKNPPADEDNDASHANRPKGGKRRK
jgi:hypothetical protein